MRACLKIMGGAVFVLMNLLPLARAAENPPLTTNTVAVGMYGTLEVLTPKDWTLVYTNMHLTGKPESVEFHSPSNTIVIRLAIYWDGFAGNLSKPTDADMTQIVSNTVVRSYLPIAVEKTFVVEKLRGPKVTGSFARFTDAGWVPMLKDEYRNLATGMFRSGNLWGTFDLVCFDKDGPQFNQGLKIMESLRRKP